MHLLCVIPARFGSTRLPGKPLRPLAGEPLIAAVARRVVSWDIFDDVVVASDHPKVLAAVQGLGVRAVLTGGHHRSGTERVGEVVEGAALPEDTVVVNVQGDEPLLPRAAVEGAIERVRCGAAIGTAGAPLTEAARANPNRVKVIVNPLGYAKGFTRSVGRRFAVLGMRIREHLGVYAYRPEALRRWVALPPVPAERDEALEQLRPLAHGLSIGVALVEAGPHVGVDTEADLVSLERLITATARRMAR